MSADMSRLLRFAAGHHHAERRHRPRARPLVVPGSTSCSPANRSAMTMRMAITAAYVTGCHAVMLGARSLAPAVQRSPSPRADFSAFERSFKDELYKEEMLEKNRALLDAFQALPSLGSLGKADAPQLRRAIDEARECGASLDELKRYVEALQKIDPSLTTETDLAILKGAEQLIEARKPQPVRPPPDSYISEDQFQALIEASKSPVPSWDSDDGEVPDDLKSIWGRPLVFYSMLRNPNPEKQPTPVVWKAVRKQWPVLEGVPDGELQKNLIEVRKDNWDPRFI